MDADQGTRECRCGTRLARDNTTGLCGACASRARDLYAGPPPVPISFWRTDVMREALASWHMGRVIHAYRTHPYHARQLPQDVVAGWMGITQTQLSRIEKGTPLKDLDKLTQWAYTLRIPEELLWFKLPHARQTGDDPSSRADANDQPATSDLAPEVTDSLPDTVLVPLQINGQHLTLPVATDVLLQANSSTASGSVTRLDHAMSRQSGVDLATVAELRDRVQELDELYDHVPSTSLMAETGQALGQVAFLADRAPTGRTLRELQAVEMASATLMGQLVWDASQRQDHRTARAYFDQAIHAAQEIGDRSAEGHALLRKSYVAMYGERDPTAGLALTEQAAETTRKTSHVLTGLALLHAAEAHAMLGDSRACESALGRADTEFGKIDPADAAGHLFSPNQFDRLAGSCYLFLGEHRRAQQRLEEAARALRQQNKSGAIVLGNFSLSHLRQGQLDLASAALHEAIDVVEATRGGGGLNIVFDAGRELRRWRTEPVVHDVYDRLLSLMSTA